MVSIMKERLGLNKQKVSKLTLDKTQQSHMNLQRVFKYIYSNTDYMEGMNINSVGKMLDYLGYKIQHVYKNVKDVIDVDKESSFITSLGISGIDNILVYKVLNYESKEMLIFVNLDNEFKKSLIGNSYRFTSIFKKGIVNHFSPLNIDRLYGIYKAVSYVVFRDYISSHRISLDTEYKVLQSFILRESAFKKKVRLREEYQQYIDLLLLSIERAYREDLNYKLMEQYSNESKKDYAKLFQTKKNITQKIQKEMQASPFLKYFKFVELDNDVDIQLYHNILPHFDELIKTIKFPKGKSDLRFRKLGKLSRGNYKLNGAYFPSYKCIAIDIRTVSSFLHEVAHSIDYELGKGKPLSLRNDFQYIIEKYSNQFSVLAKDEMLPNDVIQYFLTPTEIFARGFELAYILRGNYNVLVGDKSKFNDIQFKAFKGLEDDLKKYYSQFMK